MVNNFVSKTKNVGSTPTAPAEEMMEKTFAQFIKEYRIKTGKSLYDIAQICHTGAGTVSRWENGYTAPPLAARNAIIKLFEV